MRQKNQKWPEKSDNKVTPTHTHISHFTLTSLTHTYVVLQRICALDVVINLLLLYLLCLRVLCLFFGFCAAGWVCPCVHVDDTCSVHVTQHAWHDRCGANKHHVARSVLIVGPWHTARGPACDGCFCSQARATHLVQS